jgi:hypothetical protein
MLTPKKLFVLLAFVAVAAIAYVTSVAGTC